VKPELVSIVDEGLGNSAYLVDLGDGRALAVDVSLDSRAIRRAADERGLSIGLAAETHLHADFLSGALQLAATDGAAVIASARGRRAFDHIGLEDGDEVDLGGLRLRALSTPGHTDEHVCYVLLDGDRALGVFTGGSLMVGTAARTDLVDPERSYELAMAQFRSLQRIATLDDDVEVWPTHGAGSFCSAASDAKRMSTIGEERETNALLAAPDEDTFARTLIEGLGTFPPYFLQLGELNRRGPRLSEEPRLKPLTVDEARHAQIAGGEIVDVRSVSAFSAAHPADALSIPLRPAFASWLGWLAPFDRPIVVLRDDEQDPGEIAWQARKIGYDNMLGEVDGGMPAWLAAGAPTASVPTTPPVEASSGLRVLDIRQGSEFAAGHVPGALHVELGALPGLAKTMPDKPTVVMCGHGERAMGAASVLARAGHRNVIVLDGGGPDEWAAANGQQIERGPWPGR
jgi:glyoxylase-like metal-dependent hydrolase (beta-lactamase superfamily II)/rhodanese-related sulfurtransferase